MDWYKCNEESWSCGKSVRPLWFLKPDFHYPSWRAVLTACVDGQWKPVTRQLGPLTRSVNSGSGNRAVLWITVQVCERHSDGRWALTVCPCKSLETSLWNNTVYSFRLQLFIRFCSKHVVYNQEGSDLSRLYAQRRPANCWEANTASWTMAADCENSCAPARGLLLMMTMMSLKPGFH